MNAKYAERPQRRRKCRGKLKKNGMKDDLLLNKSVCFEGRDMKIIRDCGHCLHKDECPVPEEQWEDGKCEYELPYWAKEKHPYWMDEGEDRS